MYVYKRTQFLVEPVHRNRDKVVTDDTIIVVYIYTVVDSRTEPATNFKADLTIVPREVVGRITKVETWSTNVLLLRELVMYLIGEKLVEPETLQIQVRHRNLLDLYY